MAELERQSVVMTGTEVVVDSELPRARWRRRFSAAVVGFVAAVAALLAAMSWFSYLDALVGDPVERCERTYEERFDSGQVLDAERQWFPPALKCTVAPGPYVEYRPFEPLADFTWAVGVHGVLVALVLLRARRRASRLSAA